MGVFRAASWLCACLLITLTSMCLRAEAQAQDNSDVQQSALARSLFDQGVALGDAGDWVGAADRFSRAHALRPTPNVAYNWASALIEIQQFLRAQELLLSVQRDEAASPELKRACSDQLRALSSRIPHVRIQVDASREQTLEVDGRAWPRAAWNVDSPLDPGPHVARLHDDGRELAREEFVLREKERRSLDLQASAATTEAAPSRWWRGWPLWTAVGVVAVGGAVTGIVLATRDDKGERAPLMGNASPGVLQW